MCNNIFITETDGKSCYISSLLAALFFSSPSYISDDLLKKNTNNEFVYVKEYILEYFTEHLRNFNSIPLKNIDKIRFILYKIGWKEFKDIYKQHDVIELYDFIINKLDGQTIELNLPDHTGSYKTKNINFIKFVVTENTNIKTILNKWLIKNHNITNIPLYVTLNIKRESSEINIEIQKKIRLFKYVYPNNVDIEWNIHSIICCDKQNHYYALMIHDHKWYLFDDQKVPCLKLIEIDKRQRISNDDIINKTKKECVMIIYKINS